MCCDNISLSPDQMKQYIQELKHVQSHLVNLQRLYQKTCNEKKEIENCHKHLLAQHSRTNALVESLSNELKKKNNNIDEKTSFSVFGTWIKGFDVKLQDFDAEIRLAYRCIGKFNEGVSNAMIIARGEIMEGADTCDLLKCLEEKFDAVKLGFFGPPEGYF